MEEHVLDSRLARARGAIGRYPGIDERYVFEFDSVRSRSVHMLGVRRPLLVKWFADEELTAERVLRPWLGWGRFRADTITEERP